MTTANPLDVITGFLDDFASAKGDLYTVHPFGETEVDGVAHIGWVEYGERMIQFIDAVYGLAGVIPDGFNWVDWQSDVAQYIDNPALLNAADLETCAKLLFVHVRKDRFCEGHLAGMLENGHIAATSIAEEHPEHVGITRDILGRATLRMAEKHYNCARQVEACNALQWYVDQINRDLVTRGRHADSGAPEFR